MEFGRFLNYYAKAPEIKQPEDKPSSKRLRHDKSSGRGEAEPGFVRFFIALGKRDNFYARDIIGVINRYTNKPVDIGRIDLMTNFSFFEVPEEQAGIIERTMRHVNIKGRGVAVDRAEAADVRSRSRSEGKADSFSSKNKKYKKNDWKQFFQNPEDDKKKKRKKK